MTGRSRRLWQRVRRRVCDERGMVTAETALVLPVLVLLALVGVAAVGVGQARVRCADAAREAARAIARGNPGATDRLARAAAGRPATVVSSAGRRHRGHRPDRATAGQLAGTGDGDRNRGGGHRAAHWTAAGSGTARNGVRAMRWRADRGSATVWMLGLAAMVVAMTQLAVARGSAVLARHRLERAADLSALAAATEIGRSGQPCLAAGRVAAENGAQLVTCLLRLDPSGRSGTVAVSLSRSVTLPLAGNHLVVAGGHAGRLPGEADTGPPAAAGREFLSPSPS
ncbi:MAG: Rv3654c family TadE-like protein, partial [Jatrophihabitans sp.]